MAESTQIFSQLSGLFNSLSTGKKAGFIIFMILGLSAFLGVVYFSSRPQFRLMYSNLPADDLSAIVGKLRDDKIPYRIGAGGDSVSIPEKAFYEVKMNLAASGLPKGGSIGFELFDQKTMGMTQFQQRVYFLRAVQGELERTINQLAAVESTRVHLVMPKKTLFKEDRKEPTASVIVKFKTNARLSADEVEGITFLIAGSVEGMDPKSVTLLDSRGRLLSKRATGEAAGPVSSAMIDYRRRLETGLESQITELIGRIVGPDKVAATVTAMLDFRQVSKVKEVYDPDNQVARSEQVRDEKTEGSEQSSSAAPGIEANLPGGAGGGGGSSTNQTTKKNETINYEIGKTISHITEPVGEIKKLSIAVLVDGTYVISEGEEGQEIRTYRERSAEEMSKITSLIKNAVGYSETRGDALVVENIPFLPVFEAPSAPVSAFDAVRIGTIVNYVMYGLLLLMVGYMGLRMVRFLTTEPSYQAMGELAGLLPSRVGELEERLAGAGRLPPGEAAPEETRDKEEDRHRRLSEQREKMKANLAKDDKAITLMVRKWLKETKAE